MASTSILPSELLELVLDNFDVLSPTDRASIINCCCTDFVLRTLCQKRLFREVEISYELRQNSQSISLLEDGDPTGRKFVHILEI